MIRKLTQEESLKFSQKAEEVWLVKAEGHHVDLKYLNDPKEGLDEVLKHLQQEREINSESRFIFTSEQEQCCKENGEQGECKKLWNVALTIHPDDRSMGFNRKTLSQIAKFVDEYFDRSDAVPV